MDLPIKRIAQANVNFNDDGTIDIVDCSYQSKLIRLSPTVDNGEYVALVHRKATDVYQVYTFSSDYYFENLSRYSLLEAMRDKLRKYQIDVKDLVLLYDTNGKWFAGEREVVLTTTYCGVVYEYKH